MSESWDVSVIDWLATLSEGEAKTYLGILCAPTTIPDTSEMLLEAVAQSTFNVTSASPIGQRASSIDSWAFSASTSPIVSPSKTPSTISHTSGISSGSPRQLKVINKVPCGLCQQRRRRCEVLQSHPRLCTICKKKGATACPPHIPNATSRRNEPELKQQDSLKSSTSTSTKFIYESGSRI